MGAHRGHWTRGASSRLELADIFRAHPPVRSKLTPRQNQAVTAILRCRTDQMGERHLVCDRCGHHQVLFKSCRDRHCPKCQAVSQARWVHARLGDLLPVTYFHVVFTIPECLRWAFKLDPATGYRHLIQAASATLLEVAANPKHLGARIGFTTVLHTWTQKLVFHPHVHCVVPQGGFSKDRAAWIKGRPSYFLPEKILAAVFKGKLLSRLEGELVRAGRSSQAARRSLAPAAVKKWVVHAKPPFAGPEKVIRYLGRYTHRIAISNHRLVSLKDGQVTFRYRDRADKDRPKTLSLPAEEFIDRYLAHVLPRGFVRIRHHGILANRNRKSNLEQCRILLGVDSKSPESEATMSWQDLLIQKAGLDFKTCPTCGEGRLQLMADPIPLIKWSQPGRSTSP